MSEGMGIPICCYTMTHGPAGPMQTTVTGLQVSDGVLTTAAALFHTDNCLVSAISLLSEMRSLS